ncbi:MAG: CDP-alcohol phosphatidyltransferase family protein [Coriobacteriia bacterium]|nr:CDP-alcohol phosphatidyltransferase family protein [Coriobacteriia bacterium]
MKSSAVSYLPDALSMSRIALTTSIIALLVRDEIPVLVILTLMLLVFASDLLDGKLARKFDSVSKLGAVLDIIADGYYVLGVGAMLAYRGIIPPLIIACLATAFLVFLLTSRMKRDGVAIEQEQSDPHRPFVFERIGRSIAVFFYFLLPTLMLVLWWSGADRAIIEVVTSLCVVLTIVSITNRVRMLLRT